MVNQVIYTFIILTPLSITAVMAFVFVGLGIVLSIPAAVVTWRLSVRGPCTMPLSILTGAAYSVALLVPWIVLTVAMVRGRISGRTVLISHALVFVAWLLGPIFTWGQVVAGISLLTLGGSPEDFIHPVLRIVGIVVFVVMLVVWAITARISVKSWQWERSVEARDLQGFKFISPFALALASTAAMMIVAVLRE